MFNLLFVTSVKLSIGTINKTLGSYIAVYKHSKILKNNLNVCSVHHNLTFK